jgi:hypothetical protein
MVGRSRIPRAGWPYPSVDAGDVRRGVHERAAASALSAAGGSPIIGAVLDHERKQRLQDPSATRRPGAAERADSPLLELQRQAGNAAVAELVQRAPDKAQSTDAPGAKPSKSGPTKDITARVLAIQIKGDQAFVTISAGTEQGVDPNMTGLLVGDDVPPMDFIVVQAEGGRSIVQATATQDEVAKRPKAIVTASSSQRGKGD